EAVSHAVEAVVDGGGQEQGRRSLVHRVAQLRARRGAGDPLHLVLDVRVASLGNGQQRQRSGLIVLLRVTDHRSALHLCVGYSVALALDLPAAGGCESEREYEMETGAVDARAVPLLHGIAPQ